MADAKENEPVNAADDAGVWRARFVDYYTQNAPSKVALVTDEFMAKWAGKYEGLMAQMVEKYGPLGQPKPQEPAAGAKARGKGAAAKGPAKGPPAKGKTVAENHEAFVEMISQATPPPYTGERPAACAKLSNLTEGFESSTFAVCARLRPVGGAPPEGENFTCVVPGGGQPNADEYTESCSLLAPKVSLGQLKLETSAHDFDYVFAGDDRGSDDAIFAAVGQPLVARAKAGLNSVVLAYGQTGSGKTHTMNELMDRLGAHLFDADGGAVSFSYFELLGKDFTDCLAEEQPEKGVQLAEVDGAVQVTGLSAHAVASAPELAALVEKAKARRSTAATEANETSSRSHGVGVISVKQGDCKEGLLYIVDLAGSEGAKDVKGHSKERMEETKQINTSLLALKECIQARRLAATPGQGHTHVPYRRAKLTHLLKDVFDISCPRLSATVVIATLSPLAADASQTTSTLKYAGSFREAVGLFGAKAKSSGVALERNPLDPALWSPEELSAWLPTVGVDAAAFEGLRGAELCAMAEPALLQRLRDPALARTLLAALWTLIVAAKTHKRRADGTLLTEEQEKIEAEAAKAAKEAAWAAREAERAERRAKEEEDRDAQ